MALSACVAVASYNDERYIRECLESLGEADEVIVSDDGSTDGTVAIASEYGEVITHDDNSGNPVRAFNEAIERTTCDRIMFLAADDWIYPGILGELKHDEDWTYCDLQLTDVNRNPWGVGDYFFFGFADWREALEGAREKLTQPLPMTGLFSVPWLRANNLRYESNPSTKLAEDTLTCCKWLLARPTIRHVSIAGRAYRIRDDSKSSRLQGERHLMEADLKAFFDELGGIE